MHVLSIAPILPYPPNHGWRVRTWHLLRALAEEHEVTLLTWVGPDEPPEHVAEVRAEVARLVLRPLLATHRGRVARIRRHVTFLRGGLPTYVQEMFEERDLRSEHGAHAVTDAIRELHTTHPVDVVVFEEEAMRLMPRLSLDGVPVAVHRLEVFEPLMRELRRASVAGRAYAPLEIPRWGMFDRAVLTDTDLIVSTSPQTVDALQPYHAGLPTTIVPNGVELRRLRTPPATGTDIAVLGSMDYGPNVDGAIWFVQHVWPLIHAKHPTSRLRLVGRDPVRAIEDLRGPDVEVTGTVPDVAAACEGVRVGVVPLRSGMGIKNKTLDFMSMGLPVITTPSGAEGVAAGPADGLITVPIEPTLLAQAINGLLDDPERAGQMGDAAYDYVARHHSWESIGATYRAALANLAARRS
ncbi:MAG: glycosyltransferase [Microthrixaceae bacterium]